MTNIAAREKASLAVQALNEQVIAFNAQVERSLRLEVEIKEVLNEIKQRNGN